MPDGPGDHFPAPGGESAQCEDRRNEVRDRGTEERAQIAQDVTNLSAGDPATGTDGGNPAALAFHQARFIESVANESAELSRLDREAYLMQIRMKRLSEEEERLVTRPALHVTRQLMAIKDKISAVSTYLPMPLKVTEEMERLASSFDAPSPLYAGR